MLVKERVAQHNVRFAESRHFAEGGPGAIDLAREVMSAAESGSVYKPLYDLDIPVVEKVRAVSRGMYGADEFLHGNNPSQGSELCSAVEMMYSFETAMPITGDVYYADYLEKIAYNVLPTQSTDDYTRKQYFQQANQVKISDEARNFFHDDHGRLVYGTTTGYPCCLSNMHQGWPKFIQNTWYATADNGIAENTINASLSDLNAKCNRIKISTSAIGTATFKRAFAEFKFSNCPP